MATKQMRVCDRDGAPGALTVVLLIDGKPRREDLCPSCRRPLEAEWERMTAPAPRKGARRLSVVDLAVVRKAAKAASGKPQDRR